MSLLRTPASNADVYITKLFDLERARKSGTFRNISGEARLAPCDREIGFVMIMSTHDQIQRIRAR